MASRLRSEATDAALSTATSGDGLFAFPAAPLLTRSELQARVSSLPRLDGMPVDQDRDSSVEADGGVAIWISFLEAARDQVGLGRILYATLVKRMVDILVATAALVLLSPVLLVVMLAIRFDSRGPAIFRQRRVGQGGRLFVMYKFRTMQTRPADEVTFFRTADGTVTHKVRNDPRVTRVGRVLRKTSLDELPQLINVLKGNMSLVGPRPELFEIVARYESWQHQRHLVRPGITGWWQVSGRGDRPMHENTELDLYYVAHLSVGLDAKILLRTVQVVLRGLGAF